MYVMNQVNPAVRHAAQPSSRRGGFSLVELLTVIFIIALLIGILVPSLGRARDYAKKVSTLKGLDSIKVGLEMFKNENSSDFSQTNGYPPSFVHPPLTAFDNFTFDPNRGEFPYLEDKPVIYGAQWLPAMLMGLDSQGFIKRGAVPRQQPALQPPKWYLPDAVPGKPIERSPLYVTPENAPILKTSEVAGRPPEDLAQLFPNWEKMKHLPVFVDNWQQPILYYASNTTGKATNMVEDEHDPNNAYIGTEEQARGSPFYFHQDNSGFTGKDGVAGWDLSNSGGEHAIKRSGHELTAQQLLQSENKETFAHYIVDRKVYSNLLSVAEQAGGNLPPGTPLRPVNSDTFLLISAGVDGKYGTSDDVSNLPEFGEQ